jgi:threonine/homoserine/homoserine lactone efflux protein
MLDHVDWAAFLIAMAAVELTPGPNMGWLAALSAQRGRRAGMLAVCGIALGLSAQLIAAATGLSALLSELPLLYETLRWAGVAFMVFLAYEAWHDTSTPSPLNRTNAEGFWRGLVANLLNPKALVFYLVVVGQFASPRAGPLWQQIVALGILHVALATVIHTFIVLLGARLGSTLETYRTAPAMRASFALMMLGIALWIAVSTGRPTT